MLLIVYELFFFFGKRKSIYTFRNLHSIIVDTFSPLGAKGTGVFVIDFTIEFVKVKGRSVS